jgi:murein DD-endopeptidase MepM/ murein hydrolase activator NlpD
MYIRKFILFFYLAISIIIPLTLLADELSINGGIYIHEISKKQFRRSLSYKGVRLATYNHNNKYYLIYGIPYNSHIGKTSLKIKDDLKYFNINFNINEKNFKKQYIKVANKYVEPNKSDLKRIKNERLNILNAKSFWYKNNIDLDFIKPIEGVLTGEFGTRRFYNGTEGRFHNGIDLAAEKGSLISAPSSGKVILTGNYYYNGKFVYLDHGKGLKSIFIHLDEILVENGQLIEKGDFIGKIGSTGKSTGPHLHWSVILNNVYINPLMLIDKKIIRHFSLER